MSRLVINKTPIDGLRVIQQMPIGDDTQSYLERHFCVE
jgi:hypothetical protein